jgi:predicted RNase H-like nuclease (RuvC/YqgF family)
MVGKLEREIEDLNGDLREAYKKMDGYEAELDDLRDELAQRATEGRGRGGTLPLTLKHSMSEGFS